MSNLMICIGIVRGKRNEYIIFKILIINISVRHQEQFSDFPRKQFNLESRNKIMHQCYYCEQLFDSKEELYNHVEVHSDNERNEEIMERKKQAFKK